jgi:hypothetical protein
MPESYVLISIPLDKYPEGSRADPEIPYTRSGHSPLNTK